MPGPVVVITVCATASYTYALRAQASRVQGMILDSPQLQGQEGVVILTGDGCPEMQAVEHVYRDELLPPGWTVKRLEGRFQDGLQNYQNAAQLVIARMRSAAFREARRLNAQSCLSLDSDVLPQPHALEVMLHSLQFDRGFYSVATCPYPSQGGGDYLAGRGIPENPILPDVYTDERILPDWLVARMEAHTALLQDLGGRPTPAWEKQHAALLGMITSHPPTGDVFFRNSSTGVLPFARRIEERLRAEFLPAPRYGLGWQTSPDAEPDSPAGRALAILQAETSRWQPTGFRRRGWMSSAYPAIGLGAMLPTDWCGFGCTLMGRNALALAQFDGYDGSGTEDLYVVFKRWHRSGLRINTLPHLPADHVIRDPDKKGSYILLQAHHENRHPECTGHLRLERRPWFQQTDDEALPANPAPAVEEAKADPTPAPGGQLLL